MITRVVEPLPLTVLRTGGTLIAQGARCPGAWIVESGALYAEVVDHDGRRLILDVLGPGDLAGGAEGPVSPVTVRAVRPSRLRPCADGVAWRRRAAHDGRAARAMLAMAFDDVPARVEARLADLAARFGRPVPGGVAIGLPLPQDDLAAMTGATRESVNRAVRRAVTEGRLLVPRRSRYVVVTQLRLVP